MLLILFRRNRFQGERGEGEVGIAEGFRADDLQRARRLHQVVHRQADDGDALAVAQHLGGDRLAGFELEIDDQVGHHDHRLAVDPQHEILVLDGDAALRARPLVDAGQQRLAAREAADQLAPDVGDLAGEEQRRAGRLDHALDDVLPFGARIEHGLADPAAPASPCPARRSGARTPSTSARWQSRRRRPCRPRHGGRIAPARTCR